MAETFPQTWYRINPGISSIIPVIVKAVQDGQVEYRYLNWPESYYATAPARFVYRDWFEARRELLHDLESWLDSGYRQMKLACEVMNEVAKLIPPSIEPEPVVAQSTPHSAAEGILEAMAIDQRKVRRTRCAFHGVEGCVTCKPIRP